jgi:hypothetical protein
MMFKVNEDAIVKNTFARMEYSGDYTTYMVKKARDLSKFPQVCAKMDEMGLNIPTVGAPNPYRSVIKEQTYPIQLGGSLSYTKMQEKKLDRNGFEGATYEPKYRKPHKFPLYKELIYLGMDMQTIYFTAYPTQDGKEKPKAKWIVDGHPTSKYVLLPWAKSDDFKLWTEGLVNKSVFKDSEGNAILDKDGEEISLREFIEVKFENCKILVNGTDIKEKFFYDDKFYTDAELIAMRDAYIEKTEKEFERKHREWELSQKG